MNINICTTYHNHYKRNFINHPQKIACYLEHHHLHHPLHHLPDLTHVIFYCSHSHHHPLPPSNVESNLGFGGNCLPTPPLS